ncbi:glutamine--tRNA ligase/YqeY domain fusion protein [Geovibrio thiophilus]|uniref:Glutamine--tRNA ligase n=1 Tax=Geovibrio thiophilus TaxID=139438 RepID=A0A3R5YYF3_9BACT|nr:glutamine--tRNA ligase/YqeY domain fusion protein [Geovibrio thiophilus]QAR32495.1 glutamine--tRNA ligase/YqeY domain fusion protein [Geovibrio thiophilus]
MSESKETYKGSNFIRNIIIKDLEEGRNGGRVHTRFPPEPNGYLHIGHAKSICLNFGMAEEFGGKCNLRFDDTNPLKEDTEYVESIRRDVKWLGFDWEDREYFASDYFGRFYEYAVQLVRDGLAFVDDLTAEEIRQYRGTLTESGRESPYRNRSAEENLDLLERMKKGEFKDGEKVLRAKIDMSSPNINMRDPVIYRIAHAEHHNTGSDWCIYPMYDFAHGLEDSIEGITHSICTLEFEDHRPLYDWFLEKLGVYHPQQIEFARLNLTNTVMSKRKLLKLVQEKYVNGWDDPRMPTIAGLRRRGFTPESIRMFTDMIGVSKSNSIIEYSLLENCLRDDLNKRAHRRMAVIDPLKMVIVNYPEDTEELLEAENNPENEADGKRMIPFSRELYIEREDFMENPPKKYFRLFPGGEIRLKHAYYVTCVNVVKDSDGNVTEVHCTYDPASKGGWTEDGRKVRGTSHWVSAKHAVKCEVRMYDNLFTKENPDEAGDGQDFTANINPDSLRIAECWGEPALAEAKELTSFQFMRQGYFVADPDTSKEKPVFNRTVSLKDSWAKEQQKG